ncbi:Structural maintenance of chromosomes protein 4 [Yamadazyma tenuis]|uniref:Structural maintenance of chromosomes protein 4 n=1 Tax=Candida tenuis TaxID=2315449 RepID=UPI0027998E8D|nr:Structural maintenance of chromosomes protein 4 [Yamadazyma tenuis]
MSPPKRSKRRISLSDDEIDEQETSAHQTFINNSEYSIDSSNKPHQESSAVNRSGLDDQTFVSASNSSIAGACNDSDNESEVAYRDQTPDISRANETSDTSNEITKDATSSFTKSSIESANSLEVKVSEIPLLAPSTPVPNLVQEPEEVLSYSQQQSSMNITSPKKRESFTMAPKKAEPRLVIDQLVLTNFKSYAGRQVIGPFNASFSAVVGPNGSGKSNVIDSMLFVFGFRASKMRQGKLSELIHNSEGNRLEFCQVDIHFNHVIDDLQDDSFSVIPDSQLVVSRKALKNNSSQYYINGKTSTYTEVTNLLKDKGIDLHHKRFLILQGEVESIAQMKPKAEKESDDGLLEYLEDIIGTSHYKELIDSNLSKVDELNDVCIEKSNRFELVEKDKNQLEEKKTEALRFLEMEKKMINLKSIQFQINLNANTSELAERQRLFNELNEEYEEEKTKNEELNQQLESDLKEQKSINYQIVTISKEIGKRAEKSKAINKAIVSVDEKIKNLNGKLRKAIKSKEQSEQSLSMSRSKLNTQNEMSAQFKDELDQLVKELTQEKATLDEIRQKMTSKTSVYSKEIESLQTKLEPWNDKLKEKENSIQLINSSIEMLNSQKLENSKKLEAGKERLINIKAEGKQKEIEYQETQEKLDHIVEQIGLGEGQIESERKQLSAKKTDLINMRTKVQDSLSVHSHNQNKSRVLSSLSRLAKSGRINGFYGRLGDLGIIDDKYDIAISTACPALDSIVVETVETAQTCIQYLRKNSLGYGTFICLNKLRNFNTSPISTPGNPATVKRLFDLIKPKNEKFLTAFYSKLFDTLVATNLQEAKQVAYGKKRFRVVTLDGKLVDTSGTMSGGGNSFAKGGMILASSKLEDKMDLSDEDVQQLQQDLSSMESKYEAEYRDFQIKESQLRSLKDLHPETQFNLSKLKLEIEALSSEKREVSALCKRLINENESNENSAKIEQEIQFKESEKNEIIKGKDELKLEMKDLESKIGELEEKIMEAGGVELRLQSAKVDSIKQKIEIINDKTSNEKLTIRKLENEIKRTAKASEESSKEIEKAETELETIKSQDTNKQEELDALNKEIDKLTDEKEALQESLEGVNEQLEAKNSEIKKFKSLEIELNNKLEKLGNVIKKIQREISVEEENLGSLLVRNTTDYISWLEPEEQEKYNGNEIKKLTTEELERVNIDEVDSEIVDIEKYMANVKTDIEILKEYGLKIQEFKIRQQELDESISSRDEIKNYCEDLKRKRLDEFMEGFNTISLSLKEMYQMITMGGNAELELVDSLDPFSEGILFSVMPPKKSWRNISNLSGGEKTLSSLALVFALHKYKPTPLYVMDEIDAALDFRNVSIVANYIKERTKNGQFIVISLRNNMFELAKQLVGIYKVNNMTKSISLQNKEFLN